MQNTSILIEFIKIINIFFFILSPIILLNISFHTIENFFQKKKSSKIVKNKISKIKL